MAATPHNHALSLVRLPGSDFIMGGSFDEDYARDGEVPVHPVRITGFELSPTPVTNRQFAAFVEATGYQTDAERFDSSAVFHLALQARSRDILGTAAGIGWWLNIHGADWAHPAVGRGRVGILGKGRARRSSIRLGRRIGAGRKSDGQHLARGRLAEHAPV